MTAVFVIGWALVGLSLSLAAYSLVGVVSYAGESYNVYSGTLNVTPNLANSDSIDPRSHARKCLEALQAVMEKRASLAEASYTIFGERGATLTTIDEALKLLTYYQSRVSAEEQQERTNRGERSGIFMRFRSPR